MKGNSNLIGRVGGIGTLKNPVTVAAGSAAVIASQFGGKGNLRSYGAQISGSTNGTTLFTGVTDIIGGTSSIAGLDVQAALEQMNPGDLIIELPSAAQDLGVVPITLTLPDGSSCPSGTN